jgi:hypothetical protein
MADKDVFERYLLALRKTAIDDKTEHTDRAALESLLQQIADDTQKGIKVQHEPNHVAAIADSLAFTIEQMAKIDVAYKKAFPDRG